MTELFSVQIRHKYPATFGQEPVAELVLIQPQGSGLRDRELVLSRVPLHNKDGLDTTAKILTRMLDLLPHTTVQLHEHQTSTWKERPHAN